MKNSLSASGCQATFLFNRRIYFFSLLFCSLHFCLIQKYAVVVSFLSKIFRFCNRLNCVRMLILNGMKSMVHGLTVNFEQIFIRKYLSTQDWVQFKYAFCIFHARNWNSDFDQTKETVYCIFILVEWFQYGDYFTNHLNAQRSVLTD